MPITTSTARTTNHANRQSTLTVVNSSAAAAYISARFPDRRTFSILARVPVVTGRTMTPDWTLSNVRRHEWPAADE